MVALRGDELGWRLASLVDGEGCFSISPSGRGGAYYRCAFIVGLRADDRPFLELMQVSTGWGILVDVKRSVLALASRPGSKPMVHWQINRQAEVTAFAELLERYPPLSKKARDFAVWRLAIDAWAVRDWARMGQLKDSLREVRRYTEDQPPEAPENPQLSLGELS